ncbi:GspA [Desulforapulum autotrophicum HRM2]|uniref:GspA n=1 Tax=Desulforapulum autotrophicum (strain ATCC 43914 / DSM 3382 / VKM B-1955 / HRM2) TaxID=177437 RepID=C0QDS9_DESAH|nr:AAA family ATPase [Desulforapulum autotrophicum]ACN17350.1 GspA [Desulforapulum autotrophicum HRM2]
MYRNHFNLTKKPFSISSDPEFLWLGPCHAKVLASLTLALDRGGVLVLTGDVGTGKTTLVNTIVQGLPPSVHTAKLPDPCFEMHLLFSTIAQDLGFEFHNERKFETILARFLEKILLLNERCLVIVDEAQRIGNRFLKALYSWQDLGNGNLPITVLLVGQNEFDEMLPLFNKGRFLEKTTLNQKLVPLSQEETADYVRFRMLHSGTENEIFSETALNDIATISKGYPRMINILCDHCLLIAHREKLQKVDSSIVKIAAKKLLLPQEIHSLSSGKDKTDKTPDPGRRLWVMASMLCLGVILIIAFFIIPDSRYKNFKRHLFPVPESRFKPPVDAAGSVAEVPREKVLDKPVLKQAEAMKPDAKVLIVPKARESVKDFVDEVFKGVERRMLQSRDEPVIAADRPTGKESIQKNKPMSKTIEQGNPDLDAPDPGDVITWLLERKDSTN